MGRKALFLGDLIDRGPQNIEVVRTAKAMCEAGEAVCLMGNHELNAIHYATPDPMREGEFLRPHSAKNLKQHRVFLDEYKFEQDLLAEHLDWFKTLPLWIDHAEFRAVHACWNGPRMALFDEGMANGLVRPNDFWIDTATPGNVLMDAVEVILKGPEIQLPQGVSYTDKDGNRRTVARCQWWGEQRDWRSTVWAWESVYRELDKHAYSPPSENWTDRDDRPVFFGHYWMTPHEGSPRLISERAACLDFSIGKGAGGLLGVFRWDFGAGLDPGKLLGFGFNRCGPSQC
jgi:Calcineurin-like phosphoesterase